MFVSLKCCFCCFSSLKVVFTKTNPELHFLDLLNVHISSRESHDARSAEMIRLHVCGSFPDCKQKGFILCIAVFSHSPRTCRRLAAESFWSFSFCFSGSDLAGDGASGSSPRGEPEEGGRGVAEEGGRRRPVHSRPDGQVLWNHHPRSERYELSLFLMSLCVSWLFFDKLFIEAMLLFCFHFIFVTIKRYFCVCFFIFILRQIPNSASCACLCGSDISEGENLFVS